MKLFGPDHAKKGNIMRYLLAVLMAIQVGCATQAEPIEFGKDACHFCKMSIVQKQFAAQCVSKKGKQFKYDGAECMVGELRKAENESDMGILLVSNYAGGPMLAAANATYLISPKIKSPMGAFLSAFATPEEAAAVRKDNGGELYTWQTLKEKLSSDNP